LNLDLLNDGISVIEKISEPVMRMMMVIKRRMKNQENQVHQANQGSDEPGSILFPLANLLERGKRG
jgi:hypothetical protein